jgi:hypothetical protein
MMLKAKDLAGMNRVIMSFFAKYFCQHFQNNKLQQSFILLQSKELHMGFLALILLV